MAADDYMKSRASKHVQEKITEIAEHTIFVEPGLDIGDDLKFKAVLRKNKVRRALASSQRS